MKLGFSLKFSLFLFLFLLSAFLVSSFLNKVFAQQAEFGRVIAHIYEDTNKNGVKDNGEEGIDFFNVRLHVGQNCSGRIHWYANTNPNGDAPMGYFSPFISVGEYSIDASPRFGWIATTPTCTNVQITSSEINTYDFGMFKTPVPNHYTQLDPIWSNQTYDHADSIGPFFCGSTIGQCGCAITAATALLTSYSVYTSPDGADTTPEVLNTWLINRPNGYINGGINWFEIAKYAYEANKVDEYSPKIDYKGRIDFADYETLKTDLDSQKPVILQVNNRGSMHFVLAGSYLNNSINIHDPLVEEYYTKLDNYNNTFAGMRRYELTNTDLSAILLAIPAPAKIMVTDSQGRRLGQDPNTGEIFKEIPGGNFYFEAPIGNFNDPDRPEAPDNMGTYFIEILDPTQDSYKINTSGENKKAIFIAYDKDSNDKSETFDVNGSLKVNLQYDPTNITNSSFTKVERQVKVDYLPGTNKNRVVIKNLWLPISILASNNFNPREIIIDSITIGNAGKPFRKIGIFFDVNADKLKDLTVLFNPQFAEINPADKEVCVSGITTDGNLFKGCDSIRIIGNGP